MRRLSPVLVLLSTLAGCVRFVTPTSDDVARPSDAPFDRGAQDRAADRALDATARDTHGVDLLDLALALEAKPDTKPGVPVWARGLAGTGDDSAWAVALDQQGNLYLIGRFQSSLTLDGASLTSTSANRSIFVVSLDAAGKRRWWRAFGGVGDAQGVGVALDAAGNVYVTGDLGGGGTADLGNGAVTLPSGTAGFIASYTTAGAYRWAKVFPSFSQIQGVTVDPATGNLYVTGGFMGSVNFGGGALGASGACSLLAASFSSSGGHLWSKGFGSSGPAECTFGIAITRDSTPRLYLAGFYQGAMTMGSSSLTPAGGQDILFASLTTSGSVLWAKGVGGSGIDVPHGIAVGASLFVVGSYGAAASLGGTTLPFAGNIDLFVASYNPTTGAHLWSKGFGGAVADQANDVALLANGDLAVTGYFSGPVDFGAGPIGGMMDLLLAAFSPQGTLRWAKAWGGSGFESGEGLAVTAGGVPIVVGHFSNTFNLGGLVSPALVSAGSTDALVFQLP